MAEEEGKTTKAEEGSDDYVFDFDEACKIRDAKTSEERKAFRLRVWGTEVLGTGIFGQPDVDYEAEGSYESDSNGSDGEEERKTTKVEKTTATYILNFEEGYKKAAARTPDERKAFHLRYWGVEDLNRGFSGDFHPDMDYEAEGLEESDSDESDREVPPPPQQQQQQPPQQSPLDSSAGKHTSREQKAQKR